MNPPPLSHPLVADPAFPRLKDHLIRATGLAYYADKDAELAGRVAPRLAVQGARDCAAYLDLLTSAAACQTELDVLIEDLTIGETFFFRHQEVFNALRTMVLPDLLERNRHTRQLRIWSAGCSIGAEPYSLAILLRRELAHQLAGWDVNVIGTDINRRFLARAREGRFEDWTLRGTPEEVKRACFVRSGNTWLVAPEYREGVSFQYHNLVTHPVPSRLNNLFAFDLILCRNVTIYFSPDIVHRLVDHFHQTLVEGGWLVVGHAEPNLELYRAFRTVNACGAVLYQKSAGHSAPTFSGYALLPSGGGAAPVWSPPDLSWTVGTVEKAPVEQPAPPAPATSLLAKRECPELEAIRVLADLGEWEKAARCCQAALASDNLNPTVFFYHALVQEQMGHHADAEQALRRALYLDRQFVLAHYYLGLLLQKLGNLRPAERSFRNVVQLLARTAPDKVFVEGDGITALELAKLTAMHLKVLEGV